MGVRIPLVRPVFNNYFSRKSMRVSLRKANALQQSIRDLITEIGISNSIHINEFQDASKILAEAQTKMTANLERRVALQEALYSIRAHVAEANHTSGIQQLLTDVQRIDRVQGEYSTILRENVKAVPLDEIEARQAKFRKQEQDIYNRNEIITSVFNENSLGTFKVTVSNLKTQKQSIQDKILELNVKTEIDLPQELVDVLKKENLI